MLLEVSEVEKDVMQSLCVPQQEMHSTDPWGSGSRSYNCRKELHATQKEAPIILLHPGRD